MAMRLECVWLEMYVTYGEADVDLYRCQREEEYGSDSDRHLHLVVEVVPWRGSVRTTDVNVYE